MSNPIAKVEDVPPEIRQAIILDHWRQLASRGGKVSQSRISSIARSERSKRTAEAGWRVRRVRYPESNGYRRPQEPKEWSQVRHLPEHFNRKAKQ